jgi:hypothetical protein
MNVHFETEAVDDVRLFEHRAGAVTRHPACDATGAVIHLSESPREVTCKGCQRTPEFKAAVRLGPKRAKAQR